MRRSTLTAALLALLALALAAGCTSKGSGGEQPAGPAETASTRSTATSAEGGQEPATGPLVVGWVLPGTDTTDSVAALELAFPDQVTSVVELNAADAAAAATSVVSQGAGLVLSELPGACAPVPDTPCVEPGTGEALGPSAVTLDATFWDRAYLLGLAAGLVTETKVTGFLAAGDSPREVAAVNAWALGCQTVSPNCVTRLAVVEPGGEKKALESLAKQRVDVLGTTVLGPALCETAGEDLLAVQPALVPGDVCGRALAVASLAEAATPLVEGLLAGDWQGGRSVALPVGAWTPRVPAADVAKVDEAAAGIAAGKSPFVGPLYDDQGVERVPEGQALDEAFLASQWDWLLGGVFT